MDSQLPRSRSNTLLVPPGCRLTPLIAIDAGLSSILDGEPPSPFDQVRFEPSLKVPQHDLKRVPIYVAFHRELPIGSLLSLPAKQAPAETSTRLCQDRRNPRSSFWERTHDGPNSDS